MYSTQWVLIVFLLLLNLLAFPLGHTATANDLTANEILSRMKDTYANAKTYQDKGLVKFIIRFPERNHTVEKPFSTAFVRPDRLRYEYKEIQSLAKTSKFVAYQNGNQVKVHWDMDEGASKIKSIDEALAAAAGISGGSARTVPTMLLPKQSRFRNAILFYSPERTDDEVVDGIDCFKIEDLNDYRNLTLWIDKQEFLIRKMYVEKDLEDSLAETTTTYLPILDGAVEDKALNFGVY